jgi:hypothetical protein
VLVELAVVIKTQAARSLSWSSRLGMDSSNSGTPTRQEPIEAAAEAKYRLNLTAYGPSSLSPLTNKISFGWWFTSGCATKQTGLPLSTVRFTLQDTRSPPRRRLEAEPPRSTIRDDRVRFIARYRHWRQHRRTDDRACLRHHRLSQARVIPAEVGRSDRRARAPAGPTTTLP